MKQFIDISSGLGKPFSTKTIVVAYILPVGNNPLTMM